jgi:F0F1-type ATP synthase membrane subunit b/b'
MDKPTKDMLKKAIGFLEDAKNIIDGAATDAREGFDELSEKAQEGEKGEALNKLADSLEEMDNDLDNILSNLGDIVNEK